MTEPLPLRIFLASPGDVEGERAMVQECVIEHNHRREGESNVAYEVIGWDRIRGTARRPQDALNELIAESHFLVALFKGQWGSDPGSPWGYSSGTEEELFTALLELGQEDQPLRDVWVAFVQDPAPDRRIYDLRQQITEQHSMMFETVANLRDLKEKFTGRLTSWEALATTKIPRHVELLPSSGKDVLGAANLRQRGEKLIDLGQTDAGRAALEEAAALGGLPETLAYARCLRRLGHLRDAYAATQRAIDYFSYDGELSSAAAVEAFSAQARVLSAMGQHLDAIGRLEHALRLLETTAADSGNLRCRILDDRGLALKAAGDLIGARLSFKKALQLRRHLKHPADLCQSLVNLIRLEVSANNITEADRHLRELRRNIREIPSSGLRANAEVVLAQSCLRQGCPGDGVQHAALALAINRQIANRRGEAIAHFMLASCYRDAGLRGDAEMHAQRSIEINQSIENAAGVEYPKRLLNAMRA